MLYQVAGTCIVCDCSQCNDGDGGDVYLEGMIIKPLMANSILGKNTDWCLMFLQDQVVP